MPLRVAAPSASSTAWSTRLLARDTGWTRSAGSLRNEENSASAKIAPTSQAVRRRCGAHPNATSPPSSEAKKMFACDGSWRTKPALKVMNDSSAHSATSPTLPRPGSAQAACQATAKPSPMTRNAAQYSQPTLGSSKLIASE